MVTLFHPFVNQLAGEDFPWWALFEDDVNEKPGQSCSASARNCRAREPQPSTSRAAYGQGPRNPTHIPEEFLSTAAALASEFLPNLLGAMAAAGANSTAQKNEGSEEAQPKPSKTAAAGSGPATAEEFLSHAASFASTFFPDLYEAVTGAGAAQKKEDGGKPADTTTQTSSEVLTQTGPNNAFEVKLNVSDFKPEQLSVKTVENSIVVEGKHEEKPDEQGFVSRSFVRRFPIPEGVKPETVDCKLTSDGFLVLSAPLPVEAPVTNERSIPISLSATPAAIVAPSSFVAEGSSEKKPVVEGIGNENTAPVPMTIN